jgi:hypothetical protein
VNEAALAFGLVAEWPEQKVVPPEVYLWPENVAVWAIFQDVRTQWNVGMGGPVGLNYSGVDVLVKLRVKKRDRPDVFSKIQVMERAMLEAWSEQRDG